MDAQLHTTKETGDAGTVRVSSDPQQLADAIFALYLLPPCDVCSVGGVGADSSAWRDGHTGQEVRILVVSVADLHSQRSRRLEFLFRVGFLFHAKHGGEKKGVFSHF